MELPVCKACGHETFKTVAKIDAGEVLLCYARSQNGRWVKGCDYDNATPFARFVADIMIWKSDQVEKE